MLILSDKCVEISITGRCLLVCHFNFLISFTWW
uniref:Uncharacterized protein n=1 Tax=Anguilla anguilla TaxID=7936 RepID=A0A0E9R9F6_ANGAN